MTENAPPRIRPGWVTAIALLTWLSIAWTVLAGALFAFRLLPATVATRQYFAGFTRFDWTILSALSAMHLMAVTLLWLLRRTALWWFMATSFLGAANSARLLVMRGLTGYYASLGTFGIVVGFLSLAANLVVSAAILAYIVSLYRRGALG